MDDTLAVADRPIERLKHASQIISSASMWAAGAGAIPLPLVDIGALGAVQVKMADDIAKLYGQSFGQEAVRSTISVLLATLLPTAGAGFLSSGLKMVPGIGTLLGICTFPALSSAATYAMGRVLVRHFEGGGTVSNFSADRVHDDLRKEFTAVGAKSA